MYVVLRNPRVDIMTVTNTFKFQYLITVETTAECVNKIFEPQYKTGDAFRSKLNYVWNLWKKVTIL